MLIKPTFFDEFQCAASACGDTCCIGWEIGLDEDTAARYQRIPDIAFRLIRREDETLLCEEGKRCPFLRCDGLCELIRRYGEDILCDICREHPRFYVWAEGVTEAGLGLCCEEAARLWLSETPVTFVCEDDGEEPSDQTLLVEQFSIIAALSDESRPLGERLAALLGGGTAFPGELFESLRAEYAGLEYMNARFPGCFNEPIPVCGDCAWANLAVYFVYRYYLSDEDGMTPELAVRFAAVSLVMIRALGGESAMAAKDYSKEIEYDPDNVAKLCAYLAKIDPAALSVLVRRIFI
ncbi:MAG: flagellin lysine-N-methylase [Clostridia bacterium]|nr:flagellin lysine-N-methylase [Clostridia bacterium]